MGDVAMEELELESFRDVEALLFNSLELVIVGTDSVLGDGDTDNDEEVGIDSKLG